MASASGIARTGDIAISNDCFQTIEEIFENIQQLVRQCNGASATGRDDGRGSDADGLASTAKADMLDRVLRKVRDAIGSVVVDEEASRSELGGARGSGGADEIEVEEVRSEDGGNELEVQAEAETEAEREEVHDSGAANVEDDIGPDDDRDSGYDGDGEDIESGNAQDITLVEDEDSREYAGANDQYPDHVEDSRVPNIGDRDRAEDGGVETSEVGHGEDQDHADESPETSDDCHVETSETMSATSAVDYAAVTARLEKRLSEFTVNAHRSTAYFWAVAAIYELGVTECRFPRGRRAAEIEAEIRFKLDRLDALWTKYDRGVGVEAGGNRTEAE
ncbi:hypothetical protein BDV95DRAFT_657449 [Massariosphaeria phaeospora]|uniref:Uncharacterized protein n=1 Tax=Massariosphaeria phaeospora TaxID=100035 RepID=A0A7C8MFD4_9PLEO|nr:hypothetical protein BDV95DRAFT_657449 [Massariosphaeria phaeospora]